MMKIRLYLETNKISKTSDNFVGMVKVMLYTKLKHYTIKNKAEMSI